MSFRFRNLSLNPFTENDLEEVGALFRDYPHKDFQLQQLDIPKNKMVDFLKRSLYLNNTNQACLRESGRVVGLIGIGALPWMSRLFGAKMYSLRHFLTADRSQGYFQTMIRYVLDQMPEVDFLDCRVASGDIQAIHALENLGFRFVGNEVYLARSLTKAEIPEKYGRTGCVPCPDELKSQVLALVEQTHVHNRFMYDPEVTPEQANNIFRKYVSGSPLRRVSRPWSWRPTPWPTAF